MRHPRTGRNISISILACAAAALTLSASSAAAQSPLAATVGRPFSGTGTTQPFDGSCSNLRDVIVNWRDGTESAPTSTGIVPGPPVIIGDNVVPTVLVSVSATHTFRIAGDFDVAVNFTMTCSGGAGPYDLQRNNEPLFKVHVARSQDEAASCPLPATSAVAAAAGRFARPIARAAQSSCRFSGVEGKEIAGLGVNAPPQCRIANAVIDFGDGTSAPVSQSLGESGTRLAANHTYKEEGDYEGAVDYEQTCPDPTTGERTTYVAASLSVHVSDAPIFPVSLRKVPWLKGVPGIIALIHDTNKFGVREDFTATIDYGDGTSAPAIIGVPVSRGSRSGEPFFEVYAFAHTFPKGSRPFLGGSVTVVDKGGARFTQPFTRAYRRSRGPLTHPFEYPGVPPTPTFDFGPGQVPAEPRPPSTESETPPKRPAQPVKPDLRKNQAQASQTWYGGFCSSLPRGFAANPLCLPWLAQQIANRVVTVEDPPDPALARVLPVAGPLPDTPSRLRIPCGRASRALCKRLRPAAARYAAASRRVASLTRAMAQAVDRYAGARSLARLDAAFSRHAQLTQLGAMKAFAGQLAGALTRRFAAGRSLRALLRKARVNARLPAAQVRTIRAKLSSPTGPPDALRRLLERNGIAESEALAVLMPAPHASFDFQRFLTVRERTSGLLRFYHSMSAREVAEIQQSLAAGAFIDRRLRTSLGHILEHAARAHGVRRSRAARSYIRSARKVSGPMGALLRYAAAGL
jgi:hypothetical protein